jgi:xanthine dehydrogenase accessory factor
MSAWIDSLGELFAAHTACVMVTVVDAGGSTPRGAGTKMIVTGDAIFGTIGGGRLELAAIGAARTVLAGEPDGPASRLQRFSLGPSLGQCCGGRVTLCFEAFRAPESGVAWLDALDALRRQRAPSVLVTLIEADRDGKMLVTARGHHGTLGGGTPEANAIEVAREVLRSAASDDAWRPQVRPLGAAAAEPKLLFEPMRSTEFEIHLFGAGHVGKALVAVLAGLPCRLTWIDGRAEQFPEPVPANVSIVVSDAPQYEVDAAGADAAYLVMTHSHGLDQTICERILRRGDFGYLGLIGSRTKRGQFEKRLRNKGIPGETLQRMVCPIGIAEIPGKHPAEIAIAVAAQILQWRGRAGAA